MENNNSKTNVYLTLNNGYKIPQLGFGTSRIEPNDFCEGIIAEALKIGYRHIDTAHFYGNERPVGSAIRKSGIKREEIYLTSKIWPCEYGKGITEEAIEKMLKRFELEYIDLVLIHWPFGEYLEAWKDLEKCVKKGKIRSIGVSNFYEKELTELLNICTIKPVLDQIECHPCRNQNEFRKFLDKYDIKLGAYEPIAKFDPCVCKNSAVENCEKKYNKDTCQIILRWHIQHGNIPTPKSCNPNHMKSNLQIFDFELTNDEMNSIDSIAQMNHWKPRYGTFQDFKANAFLPLHD